MSSMKAVSVPTRKINPRRTSHLPDIAVNDRTHIEGGNFRNDLPLNSIPQKPAREKLSLFNRNPASLLSDSSILSDLSPGLEMNGIIRSTVFPNRLRTLRRSSGFSSLISFHPSVKKITYSRLAKIERGHVFPRISELKILCKALECDIDDILLDISSPDFNHESWAKSHIEGSLSRHTAGFEDMLLAAALRLQRKEMKLSTSGLRYLGLPAATVSRIENAERPFDLWAKKTRESVFRVFGVQSRKDLNRIVLKQAKAGDLSPILRDLFSVSSLISRQVAFFVNLSMETSSEMAARLARHLEIRSLESQTCIQPAESAASRSADLTVLEGLSLSDGSLVLKPSKERVSRNSKSNWLAIRVDRKILGPIDPRSIILFETVERQDIDEDMVVAVLGRKSVKIGSVRKSGRGYRIIHNDGKDSFSLSSVNGNLARLVQVRLPN